MESPQASQMSIVAGCFLLLEYTDLYVITAGITVSATTKAISCPQHSSSFY